MTRRIGRLVCGVLAASFLGVSAAVLAAPVPQIPSSPQYADASQIISTLNYLINLINVAITPNATATYSQPRNLLDNGGMQVQQRGTAAQTCGTTTIPASAHSADRWGCNVNVTSGAGSLQVVTTNIPTLPAFNAGLLFYRTSGALLQPQCVMQEIASTRIIPMQQQQVVLSFYAYALAGMVTDNGGVMTAYIFTGTGTDQGLQSFTASPAITPAWTGISSTLSQAFTLTASMARYSASFVIPSTVKEAAVALCWTPTSASGAGATDGFEFTGVQLEQGSASSSFEFRSYVDELKIAQSYYAQWADNLAATFTMPGTCVQITSGSAATCTMILPATMRTSPTSVVATATSFGMTKVADGTAEGCTTFSVIASSNTPNSIGLNCNVSETAAVGTMHRMLFANTGAANTLTVSADY